MEKKEYHMSDGDFDLLLEDIEEAKQNQEKKSNKIKNCWIYGIGSAAVAIGGGALMILAGPTGMIMGGIILGAGISGEVATV